MCVRMISPGKLFSFLVVHVLQGGGKHFLDLGHKLFDVLAESLDFFGNLFEAVDRLFNALLDFFGDARDGVDHLGKMG